MGDLLLGCRPGTHQAVNIGLDKLVKTPSARLDAARDLVIQPNKHCICVHGEDNLDLRLTLQAPRKVTCGAVRVLSIPQPYVPRQKSNPRRSQKTHLGTELSGLFHSIVELPRNLFVRSEEHTSELQSLRHLV